MSRSIKASFAVLAAVVFSFSVITFVHAQEVVPADAPADTTVASVDTSTAAADVVVSTDTTTTTDAPSDAPAADATTPPADTSATPPTDTTSDASSTDVPPTTDSGSTPTRENAPNESTIAPEDTLLIAPTTSNTPSDTTTSTDAQTASAVVATLPTPTLTTDKDDYRPGETATIWGKFFESLQNVLLVIVGQDENGNIITNGNWAVTADQDGAFTTSYTLPQVYVPLYLLAANKTTGELLAETTFTDGSATSITAGAQVGSLTYGTAASSTYLISFTRTGTGNTSISGLSVSAGLPAGATASWSSTSSTGSGNSAIPSVTLTINILSSTPVGSYTYTITSTSPILSTTGTLVVGQKSITPSITASGKTYDGITSATSTCSLTGVVAADTANVTCAAGSTVFASANAGSQTVNATGITLSGTAASNYSLSATTANTTATITKATSSTVITCSPTPVVYTGSSQTPCTAAVTGVGGLSTTATVTYANNTNVGTATADATYDGDANHNGSAAIQNAFAITQATQTITFGALGGKTYGDADFGVSATGGASGQPVTFSSQTLPVCTVTDSTVHIVTTGTCTVRASQAGNTNYSAASNVDQSFTVSKANTTTTVTCNAGPFTYSGSAQTPCSVTVTGPGGLSLTPTPTYSNNVNAGTASASYSYAGDANYNASSDSKNFTIGKANALCTINGFTGSYDGAAHGTSGSCTGVGGPSDVLTGLTSTDTFTNFPGGTASWTFTNANYADLNGSAPIVINKVTPTATLTVSNTPQTYTGAAQSATVGTTVSSVPGAVANILTDGAASQTDANSYAVTADFVPTDTTNYNSLTGLSAGNFVIKKADTTTTVTCSPKSLTYTGAALTPCTVSVTGANLSETPDAVYADNVNAGTATASYTYTPDANHNGSNGSDTFTITKVAATCTVTGYTGVYDAAPHGATGSCTGVNDETLSGLTFGATFTNVPGGTAHWVFTDVTGNYNDNAGDVSIDISKATVTVTADNQSMETEASDPAFTFAYGPFQGADTSAVIDTAPVCTVSGSHTAVTTYPITCSGGADNNYDFSYTPGTLTVNDHPAPVITNEQGVTATANSITITWTTDHLATSRVVYGSSPVTDTAANTAGGPNYGYTDSTGETDASPKVLTHSVTVTGLNPGSTYYLRAVSHGSPESYSSEIQKNTIRQTGMLTVTKVVSGGSKVVSDFPLFVDETSITSGIAAPFVAGSHTISETANVDYVPSFSSGCVAGENNASTTNAIYDFKQKKAALLEAVALAPNDPGNEAKLNLVVDIDAKILALLGTLTGSANVPADGAATCTITNTFSPAVGALKVNKVAVGGDGTFSMSGPTNFDITTVGGTGSYTFQVLRPTTYTIEEAPLPIGWVQTGNTCVDVEVVGGQTAQCTITNTYTAPTGGLTVIKTTFGGNGTFNFTGQAGSFQITTLGGTGTKNISGLVAGNYTVAETTQAGWTQVDSECDGVIDSGAVVAAGATTTCNVINAAKGHVVVKKVTTGGIGSFNFNSDWGGFTLTTTQQNVAAQIDSGLIDPSVAGMDIVAGEYSVSEETPDGWTLSSAICDNGNTPDAITVNPGQTVTCTFTNAKNNPTNQKGSISGVKYEDVNGNGIQDSGEQGVPGFTIYIDANNNGVKDKGDRWTTSRKDGSYSFKYVSAGTYTLREVVKKGWTQTMPSTGSYTVTVSSGQSVTGKNFGNFKNGRIRGMKFEDKNHNGLKDKNEKGLKGWTIQLKKGSVVVASTVTNGDGHYSFRNLGPGTYSVVEVQQSGWQQWSTNPAPIMLKSRQNATGNDFGNAKI